MTPIFPQRFLCWFLLLILGFLAACSDNRPAMVSTANPHASQAALAILQQGGSAVDAAIAAQLVLTLTEPQSSGIGGGLFLMHWNEASQQVNAYDGREMAPQSVAEDWFVDDMGDPMPWQVASKGGRPVGIPGVIAALALAHEDHGELPWADLFQPAIELAEAGFAVSARLHEAIATSPDLRKDDQAAQLYYDREGQPLPVGAIAKNPIYARTLYEIAKNGPGHFYQGSIAASIIARVNEHQGNPGEMTLEDFAFYKAVRRKPVCSDYRDYRVCGMPPPTSGGLTNLMILSMLEPYRMAGLEPNGVQAVHLFAQASRLAFADRAKYMADPDHVDVPVKGLLDKAYLRHRAQLIDPGKNAEDVPPGLPPSLAKAARYQAGAKAQPEYGTSHLSIVDRNGNAVSMTTSVEQRFGAHIMASGFILNNQLTDFSFLPMRGGAPVANRPGPGKRPRSSMSPTLIFDNNGKFYAAIGSPGGSRIINYVGRSLIALLDWNMSMQQAIDLPRIINRGGATELELGHGLDPLAETLRGMGHEVLVRNLGSGLHGIRVNEDGTLDGGADKRREGVVLQLPNN